MIMCSAIFFIFYMTLFGTASLPGTKLFAGMMLGLGEAVSCIISGFVCRYVKDIHAFNFFTLMIGIAQLVYYWGCEGVSGSFTSLCAIFFIILGVGACINIIYLMIELRVSANKLGSSIVIVITSAMIVSTFASAAGYSDMPVPFFAGFSMFLVALTSAQFLP